ncbi:helix-turn-helix domain-containing protein [Larkinella soli]|uniref:helix-turn-helix domain-containing protein n=1 Tax=Larkinella soli TaxID=1770527 RepID=UPI000FFBE8DD|nr:helix-turn-helix transcriptional regulator [Larkinella soli]
MIAVMPETPEEIGQLIKELRKKRGMTQTELGEKFGANKSTIALYEKGRNGFSVATLKRFAEALNAELKIDIILK